MALNLIDVSQDVARDLFISCRYGNLNYEIDSRPRAAAALEPQKLQSRSCDPNSNISLDRPVIRPNLWCSGHDALEGNSK